MVSNKSKLLKKVVFGCLITILSVVVGLLSEAIGNDFNNWLTQLGINSTMIYTLIIIFTSLSLVILTWSFYDDAKEPSTIPLPEPDIEIEKKGEIFTSDSYGESNKEDGKFKIHSQFFVTALNSPINIIGIKGEYWVDGKCCYHSKPEVSVDNKSIIFSTDYETFQPSLDLKENKPVLLTYERTLCPPPKMGQKPHHCEDGILKIELSYKIPNRKGTFNKKVKFKTN